MINPRQRPRIMPFSRIGSWTQADAVWSFWDGLVSCAIRHKIPSPSWFIDYRLMQFASCCLSFLRASSQTWPSPSVSSALFFFYTHSHDWLVGGLCRAVKNHMSQLSDTSALTEARTPVTPALLMEKWRLRHKAYVSVQEKVQERISSACVWFDLINLIVSPGLV